MARITNSLRHTHQYFRMQVTGLWHCSGIDGCTHYMPKNMPEPVGRMSICWGCKRAFMLTPLNMLLDKPMCDTCSSEHDNIETWLEEKLNQKRETERAFGLKPSGDEGIRARAQKMHDEIEVIEADETHTSECAIYDGEDCNCK